MALLKCVISIAGGSDQEELEAWRARMLEAKQLGQGRDREADLERAMKSVAGVGKVYIYKTSRLRFYGCCDYSGWKSTHFANTGAH